MKALYLTVAAVLAAGAAIAGPKDDLIAADKTFSAQSIAQGSNAAFLAFMADDARIFGTGNQPPLYGKAAAAKRFADPRAGNGDPKLNVLSWTPDHAEIGGAMGYTDGHWLFVGHDAVGKEFRLTGHYLTVWRNEAGHWKMIADMGTNDPRK